MGLDVASIRSTGFSVAPGAPRATRANGTGGADTAAISPGEVPASPPPEVLEAMDAAGRVARELHEQGRELRFSNGDDGRLRIELRDLDGNVLRTIPPGELLDVATGKPVD